MLRLWILFFIKLTVTKSAIKIINYLLLQLYLSQFSFPSLQFQRLCSFFFPAGGTLAEYIQKRCNSLLDEDTILHFFVQILLALYHVHNKLILHRDLKTQNILLDKHQMIVKIGDFGISKILVSKSKAYTVICCFFFFGLGPAINLFVVVGL